MSGISLTGEIDITRAFVYNFSLVLKDLLSKGKYKELYTERLNFFLEMTERLVSSDNGCNFKHSFSIIMDGLYLREVRIEKRWFSNTITFFDKFSASCDGISRYGLDMINKYKTDGVLEFLFNKERKGSAFNLKEYLISKMLKLRYNEKKKKRNFIMYYESIKNDLEFDYEIFSKNFKVNGVNKKTLLWIDDYIDHRKICARISIGRDKYEVKLDDAVYWNFFRYATEDILKRGKTELGYPDGVRAFSMGELVLQYNAIPFFKDILPFYLRQKHERAILIPIKTEWKKAELELRFAAVDKEKVSPSKI